jgi:hypothetical protein
MSLILEALKKLERDKQVETRSGFLVMAARPWPSGNEGRAPIALAVLGGLAMMAVGAGLAFWFWRGGPKPEAPMAAAAPAPARTMIPSTNYLPPLPSGTRPAIATAPPSTASADRQISGMRPPVDPAAPAAPASTAANARSTGADLAPGRVPASAITSEGPHMTGPATTEAAEPTSRPTALPPFRLSAISERDGRRVAMLNERLVFEGDSFGDVVVVRIGDADIELKVDGKTLVVPFAF